MTLDPIPNRTAATQRAIQAIGPHTELPPTTTPAGLRSWNWTPADLRGIRAIGRSVNGAIPDSEPGHDLDDWPHPDPLAA